MDQSKTPPDLKALRVGDIVTWRSPMFGLLKGRVFLLPSGDDFIGIERHPINGKPLLVPTDWITGIERPVDS